MKDNQKMINWNHRLLIKNEINQTEEIYMKDNNKIVNWYHREFSKPKLLNRWIKLNKEK